MGEIRINRALFLALWATVVARRLGFSEPEALTLGKAITGLTAQAKGRRLGIYEPRPAEERAKVAERREVPEEGVEIAFLPMGDAEIELLRPLHTGEEGGGVARFLEKRGEGMHHVCIAVPDIEVAMAQLKAAGARLLSDVPQEGPGGRRYVFVHPKSAHGVLLELYEQC